MELVIVIVVAAVIVLWFVSIYNKLIRLKNLVQNAFSQIDVQLKRRYDLIPNLVETAKGYLKHERETLEAVVKARNQAMAVSQSLSGNASNKALMNQLVGAEGALAQTMSRLMVVIESYPELKANQTMMQLSEELTSTENKISFARQAYNDAVTEYNTSLEVFPNSLVAQGGKFTTATVFAIENTAEREAVKVNFGT